MNAYREKLLSITIGKPSDMPTRSKRNYYDRESLETVFPESATDDYFDQMGHIPSEVAGLSDAEKGRLLLDKDPE